MTVGILLSVRDKSSRFPGKVLKKIGALTVTDILISRLKMSRLADEIVIATSDDPRDAIFEDIANRNDVGIFRGSQDDKLLRYLDAAKTLDFEHVVIVDGDDILAFPEFIDKTIQLLTVSGADAVFSKGLPLGAASSGLSRRALELVVNLKNENDTEVWGGYFTNGDRFDVNYIYERSPSIFFHPEIRLTLDYEEDFELVKSIIEHFGNDNMGFTSVDLMNLLVNEKPELVLLNQNAQRMYESHIAGAAKVKFKEGQ